MILLYFIFEIFPTRQVAAIVLSMKCIFVEIVLNFPVNLLLSHMLHFGRKRTNAIIHTIYIYLNTGRVDIIYNIYIFNYIINQVHFQTDALLKCSIFLVASTHEMIYWGLDTLGINISYVTQYIHLEFSTVVLSYL